MFKFFKAMMDPGKISAIGSAGAGLAEKLYEERFGVGSWVALQGTSTLMPARDMAGTVDYFWRLSGPAVGHPEVESVEELAPDIRAEVLIDLLDGVAQKVYEGAGCSSPRDGLARLMSEAFIRDLLSPSKNADVRTVAESQLLHYSASKPVSGTESAQGLYLCPICNAPFKREQGKTASADFIENPQAHTNRGVSHGRFGYIVVCLGCYYERLLRQVLMGDRPAEIIRLEPRLNCGPRRGRRSSGTFGRWLRRRKVTCEAKPATWSADSRWVLRIRPLARLEIAIHLLSRQGNFSRCSATAILRTRKRSGGGRR